MKIGLLGGSFNPPHQGHIYISNLALKKLKLNQIWWIPAIQNPFKNKSDYKSYKERLNQCFDLAKHHPKIYVKDFQKNSLYSFFLIKEILAKHKNDEFVWIMGEDNLEKFHQWKNFSKLIKLIKFAVFSRNNNFLKLTKSKSLTLFKSFSNKENLPQITIFHTKNYDISSSQLRK